MVLSAQDSNFIYINQAIFTSSKVYPHSAFTVPALERQLVLLITWSMEFHYAEQSTLFAISVTILKFFR